MGNKPRWYIKRLDINWVVCSGCRSEFFYDKVKRKNKCPKCKINNYGCKK